MNGIQSVFQEMMMMMKKFSVRDFQKQQERVQEQINILEFLNLNKTNKWEMEKLDNSQFQFMINKLGTEMSKENKKQKKCKSQ